ncbi:monocarboxylate transporter 3-like [Mercenaria mercenaria]|uniref:monocarboxylate transporter 3-like n=1 Tax=Mercenaria mercenaria TaxID=6596 RepID=UPI00234EA33A|nr:monocarboxylate transporter 3-like [Mercenaria mercenaria]
MNTKEDPVAETSRHLEHTEKTRLLSTSRSVDRGLRIGHPKAASKARKLLVMLSCVMQLFICNGIGYGLSVMYAELVVVLDAKRADAALVQSLNMGLSAGAGILFAGFIKKYGPGICIVVASVTSSIGLFVSCFANGIGLIICFTGVLTGLAMCVCYFASFVTISLLFYKDPGFYLISMTCGTSLGQFIIPLFFEIFISQYAWSGAFILLSGLCLNCLQFGLIIHFSRDFFYKGNVQNNKSLRASAFCDVSLLTDYLIWILWSNCFLLALTANVEAWFIVDHAVSIGLTRESGSLMVSAVGLGNLIGRIIGSAIRLKCTKTPTVYHWIYLCVLTAAIHLFVPNVGEVFPLILACLATGIAMGTTAAQAPAIMFEASGLDRYPQGMAMVNVMYGIGEMLGPLLGGMVKDLLGTYDLIFYIASGVSAYMSVSTIVAAYSIRRRVLWTLPIKRFGIGLCMLWELYWDV